jgi:hypothetical protein
MGQKNVNVYCDDIKRKSKPIIISHRILISDLYLVLFFTFKHLLGHMCLSWSCVFSDGVIKWLFIALFVEHVYYDGVTDMLPVFKWKYKVICTSSL